MSFFEKITSYLISPSTIIAMLFSVLIAIAYLVLPMNYALPLFIPASLLLLCLMLGIMYAVHIYTDWQFNPEGSDFIHSRKSNTPLLMVEAHNGVGRWVRGFKEKTGDIFFAFNKNTNEGIKIDPSVQSGSVPITNMERGLRIYHYGTGSPFPMGSKQACAADEILKYVRQYYPILNVFDAETILEYLARSRSELPEDCKRLAVRQDMTIAVPQEELKAFREQIRTELLEKATRDNQTIDESEANIDKETDRLYDANVKDFVTEYRANYLVKLFIRIQEETSYLPLPQGKLFSYAEAFMNSISAFTAFDYQTLMQLFEMIARKENDIDLKWIIGICIGLGIFIFLAMLGLNIYNSSTPG